MNNYNRQMVMFFFVFWSVLFLTGVKNVYSDVIIDNGEIGTSSTGTWRVSGASDSYGIDSLWARGDATYTWMYEDQPAGEYEVLIWYSSWPSRSTTNQVIVNHADGDSVFNVDQSTGGGQWQSLGNFMLGSTASVQLAATDSATNSSAADAVWFRLISEVNKPEATIDLISPNPANVDQDIHCTGHGVDSDGTVTAYRWESDKDGVIGNSKDITVTLSAGVHQISYLVQDDSGLWSEPVSKSIFVGNGLLELIVDNDDSATTSTGSWAVSSGTPPYGTGSLWARNGAQFSWIFTPPIAGYYQVDLWWTSWTSRGTNIPLEIMHNGETTTLTINQQENGGQWNSQGIFYFDPAMENRITITAPDYPASTCADAARLTYVPDNAIPVATIDLIDPKSSALGAEIYFSGSGSDSDGTVDGYMWRSSIDGELSTEAIFTSNALSEGEHTISFQVLDNDGAWSMVDEQILFVGNINPEAVIEYITPLKAQLSDTIIFSGHGIDIDGTITSYKWESSEVGTLSEEAYFEMNAADLGPGVHLIRFIVYDNHSSPSEAVEITIIVGNAAPMAVIDQVTPNPAEMSQMVTCTGHGEDLDGNITGYVWESDIDGLISTEASFSANDLSIGNHTLTFLVFDNEGAVSNEMTTSLLIKDIPTEVVMDNGTVGTTFTGEWKVSGGPSPYGSESLWSRDGSTYVWTFTPSLSSYYTVEMWWTAWPSRGTSIPLEISHADGSDTLMINQQENGGQWNNAGEYYFDAGVEYTVTITSTAYPESTCADAIRFTKATEISVPEAGFSANRVAGAAPLTVTFTDQTIGTGITSYLWDFGDGTTSNEKNPTHQYVDENKYTVTLTVINSMGEDSFSRVNYINVNSSIQHVYLIEGYSDLGTNFRQRTIPKLTNLGASENSDGSYSYTNSQQGVTYIVHFIYSQEDIAQAFRTPGAHVVYMGHSNYGLGGLMPVGSEQSSQTVEGLRYIDDDRFVKLGSDTVRASVKYLKFKQAYPDLSMTLQDGSSAAMPYTFEEGTPAFNYIHRYTLPGSDQVYLVERPDGSYLERFPDSYASAWDWRNGYDVPPDPDNPDHRRYFITNYAEEWNRFEFVGDWPYAHDDDPDETYSSYNYQYCQAGNGSSSGTWVLVVEDDEAGIHPVYATWQGGAANATNARYTIEYSDGVGGIISSSVRVDQRVSEGNNLLGEYYFDPGVYRVTLDNDADGRVVADKVKIGEGGGVSSTDNAYIFKPHYRSYTMLNLSGIERLVDPADYRYSSFFYASCQSGFYYAGNFNHGKVYYTNATQTTLTAHYYVEYLLLGRSDQEILDRLNGVTPIYEFYDFTQVPPSMQQ